MGFELVRCFFVKETAGVILLDLFVLNRVLPASTARKGGVEGSFSE